MRFIALALSLAALCDSPPVHAADPSFLEAALKREIIGAATSMNEAQAFADARVPRMPEVKTADQWRKLAASIRESVLSQVVFRGEAASWRDAETKVEWLETIAGGPGYRIKKLRYEALPGMWIPALLYEPESSPAKFR